MTPSATRTGRPRRWWRLVALLAAIALMLVACPAEDPPEDAEPTPDAEPVETPDVDDPEAIDRLTFGVTVAERNLTPWTQGSGYPGYYMMTLVYDTLLWTDPDGEPIPWLAEDWEVSEDGLEWTFTLHEGVTFHDGEPLTADDVVFTVDYLTEHPRPRWPLGAVDEVEASDDTTVTFRLNEPRASFLLRPLADMPIIPEHIWSDIDDPNEWTTELPIGSGPYRFVEYEEESVWRFEAFEDYFLGEPLVDEIVMPYIADASAAFLAVRTGDVDAVSPTLQPELLDEFQELDDVEVVQGPGFRGWYLYMNHEREPFGNVDLRRAILHAIDMEALDEIVLLGTGTPGDPGFVHRDAPWANPETIGHERDLERAQELIDGLGLAEDERSFELIVRSDDPGAVRAAELISEWVSEIGLDLEVAALDPGTAGGRIWPDTPVGEFDGDYHIALHSWAGAVQQDPDFFTGMFHTEGMLNRTAWSHDRYDELTEEQERAVDDDERRELLFEMQEILADEVPAIALYYPGDLFPYRPDAFDGWVYYNGIGILNKTAFLPR